MTEMTDQAREARDIVDDVPMLCMEQHYGAGASHEHCLKAPDWSVLEQRIAAALQARDEEIKKLTTQNQNLQQSLALHTGPHVTMTVSYADELEQARNERDQLAARLREVEEALKTIALARRCHGCDAQEFARDILGE